MGRCVRSVTIYDVNIPSFLVEYEEPHYDYILNNARKFIKKLPRKYSRKFTLVNLTFHETAVTMTIQYKTDKTIPVEVLKAILMLWFKRWTHCWCCGLIGKYNVYCNDTLGALCSYVWRQNNEQLKNEVAAYLERTLKYMDGEPFTTDARRYLDGNWDEDYFAETFYWGLGEEGWDCVFTIATMLGIDLTKFNPYDWIAVI